MYRLSSDAAFFGAQSTIDLWVCTVCTEIAGEILLLRLNKTVNVDTDNLHCPYTDHILYTDTRYNDNFVIMTVFKTVTKPSLTR